jgi:hypothetical protein
MTLLRGLGVEELSRPELTGEWEQKLARMERGEMSRDAFMAEIQAMTEHIVAKAKGYDRDTIPGDYLTLKAPCPNCGGVVKENYRRYACTGADGQGAGCGFSFTKLPAGRMFELDEVEAFVKNKRIGPLQGFRSKAGWPFTAEMALVYSEEEHNWKLEFDFGEDAKATGGNVCHSDFRNGLKGHNDIVCARRLAQVNAYEGNEAVAELFVIQLKTGAADDARLLHFLHADVHRTGRHLEVLGDVRVRFARVLEEVA